jgi:hypothetical protein
MKRSIRLIAQSFGCCIGAACAIWFIHGFQIGALVEPNAFIKYSELILAAWGLVICLATAIQLGHSAALMHIDKIFKSPNHAEDGPKQ